LDQPFPRALRRSWLDSNTNALARLSFLETLSSRGTRSPVPEIAQPCARSHARKKGAYENHDRERTKGRRPIAQFEPTRELQDAFRRSGRRLDRGRYRAAGGMRKDQSFRIMRRSRARIVHQTERPPSGGLSNISGGAIRRRSRRPCAPDNPRSRGPRSRGRAWPKSTVPEPTSR